MNELYNKIIEKMNNLELKINKQKLEESKEKNDLISQVNILTKKILQLEKDLEKNIEKEKNKNNNKNKAPNIQINTNTSNDNDIEKNPLFHSSKSETLPNLIFQNIFGNILGVPELGDKGRSKFHEHTLVYSSYDMKSPEYAKGPYYCDHCQGEFPKQVKNFYCKSCGFDLCERCYKLSKC